MSYLGLETVKPTKPIKRGDLHIFPKTTADQIITDETTDKRLTTDLAEKMPKSGGTFTGAVTLKGDPTSNLHAATKQYVDNKTGMKLVWQNASPTSSMGSQTTVSVTLDASKNHVMVGCHYDALGRRYTCSSLFDVGYGCTLISETDRISYIETTSKTSFRFGSGGVTPFKIYEF